MQVSPVRAHRRHGPATCVLRHLRHHKRAGRIASRRRSIGAGFRRKTAFLGSTRTNSRSRAGPPDTGFSSQGGGRVSPSSGALHGPTPSAPSKSPPVRRRGVCGRCGASRRALWGQKSRGEKSALGARAGHAMRTERPPWGAMGRASPSMAVTVVGLATDRTDPPDPLPDRPGGRGARAPGELAFSRHGRARRAESLRTTLRDGACPQHLVVAPVMGCRRSR